jgi:hypothetical protein
LSVAEYSEGAPGASLLGTGETQYLSRETITPPKRPCNLERPPSHAKTLTPGPHPTHEFRRHETPHLAPKTPIKSQNINVSKLLSASISTSGAEATHVSVRSFKKYSKLPNVALKDDKKRPFRSLTRPQILRKFHESHSVADWGGLFPDP